MTRHRTDDPARSPAGRRPQSWPAAPRPGASAPGSRPRHAAAPAVRNGLAAAAATGGVLAVTAPVFTLMPAAADPPPASLALAAVGTPGAEAMAADAAAGVLRLSSLEPAGTSDAIVPGAVDAAALLKAVGLAEVARQAEEARAARETQARCDADLDGLGAVKDGVRAAARFLSCLYDEPTLIGVAGRGRVSDHPRGLAVDLMTSGVEGDRIAECALRNREALGIEYVIWKQRQNYGDGWEPMADRGSSTENHFDHVHVSFQRGGGSGEPLAALCDPVGPGANPA